MHLYGNTRGLKYLFVVSPNGDPDNILLHFTGQDSLHIDLAGVLRAYLRGRSLVFPTVVGHQDVNGVLIPVQVGIDYQMVLDDQLVKFDVPSYNPNFPLILQIGLPALAAGGLPYTPEWGTYYGDALGDHARAITAMSDRGMTATGETWSADFPNTVGQTFVFGPSDVYITRFSDQYARLWSTYLSGDDYETTIGIDEFLNFGSVIVGRTSSSPVSLQMTGPSGAFVDNTQTAGSSPSCFVASFDQNGQKTWLTYFGPDGPVEPSGIAVGPQGKIAIAGTVVWPAAPWLITYPTQLTCGPTNYAHPICGTGFIQDQLAYKQWSPPPGEWRDGWVAEFNSGFQLQWSTLFGGSSQWDWLHDLAYDLNTQQLIIVGETLSPLGTQPPGTAPLPTEAGFPWFEQAGGYYQPQTPPGLHHEGEPRAWIAAFNAAHDLVWCTPFGAAGGDWNGFRTVATSKENSGTIYVGGWTTHQTYSTQTCVPPTSGYPKCNTFNPFTFPSVVGFNDNGTIVRFNANTKQLEWSTFVGLLTVKDVATDDGGLVHVIGEPGLMNGQVHLPLLDHPDYYSEPDHFTIRGTAVLGFDVNGQFHGTMLGGNGLDYITELDVTATGKRVYIAGATASTWGMPLNQPGTVQPWYVGANMGDRDAYYAQLTLDYTVGVEDEEVFRERPVLFVYPNPAQDELVVAVEVDGPYNLCLCTADGQLVMQTSSSVRTGRLTTYNLAPGPYLLRCSSLDGALLGVRTFIVQP